MCNLPLIRRVDALDSNFLDVEFVNGHTLLLDLTSLMEKEEYLPLRSGAVFCTPKTDGITVQWFRDGQPVCVLTVQMIASLLESVS